MRLYRVKSFTGTSGLEQLVEPDPPSPVARQVLVRIRATSINYRDLIGLDGHLQAMPPGMTPNHIPMCDGAGDVVAVGPDVTRVSTGDRVALTFHPGWIAGPAPADLNVLGRSSDLNDGLLAEYTLVDESEAVIVPAHLSFGEAATLPCAGVTAWYALHGGGALLPGQDVLVLGTGGVSIFALQFAKLNGARAIGTTTTVGKQEMLRKLGADVVIDSSGGRRWAQDVLDVTGGVGVDVTVEVGGESTWHDSFRATRPGGRVSLVGRLGGVGEGIPGISAARGLNLHPTRVGSRLNFEDMNRAISRSGLRPIIDRTFEFDDTPAAFEYFRSASRVGKVVIRVP